MISITKKILIFVFAMIYCAISFAQQALFGGNEIVSPEINNDGTATFRLLAPNASSVQVKIGRASVRERVLRLV